MASTTAKSEIEQELQRLVGSMPSLHQRRVEQAVAAEERDPRDHADDVGGQERHRADQEQHHLHGRGADVEGEEIGDPEADHERQRPDDRREFQRVEIGPPGDRTSRASRCSCQHEVRDTSRRSRSPRS